NDVEIGNGFVEVVHDRGVKLEISLEHVAGESEGNAEIVAVIVVRNVVPPPNERIGWFIRMLLVLEIDVHHAVMAVDFNDGSNKNDGVVADFLDEGGVFDGQSIGELHQHFRGAGFRRMDAPVGDRKSTRLNSSHVAISYAVFCLKKKID